MKKFLVLPLAMLVIAMGCNDDPVTLTQGDVDDPAFTTFQEEFGTINELQGTMVQMMFESLESVRSTQGGTVAPTAGEFEMTYSWNEETMFWVTTLHTCDEVDNVCFWGTDSIQFLHGFDPVQYPDEELLSKIRSFLSLEIMGDGINSATAFQNMEISTEPGSGTFVLDGTGGTSLDFEDTDEETGALCAIQAEFATTSLHLVMDLNEGAGNGCPINGGMEQNGNLHVECTGDEGSSTLDRSYSVSVSFADGQITTTVISGGNIWTFTGPCGDDPIS